MKLDIPFLGRYSTSLMFCGLCNKPLGHFVNEIYINDDLTFCGEHEIDYVAKKEGWVDYREHYKLIQKELKLNAK